MKKTITAIAVLLGLAGTVSSQQPHFTRSGTIEYERRTNVYVMISKLINKDNEAYLVPALDAYKKSNPQFRILKSTLSFNNDKTLFTPIEADPPANALMAFAPLMNQNNTIYSDLDAQMSIGEKKVFDDLFLVKDSTRKIKWKITDETRDIAGYTCRRANGIMLDSVYVVAFFTGKIPVPGGPESFNGLPGMILGVALPHENVTWFATKVTDRTLPPNAINPPAKGKALDNKGYRETLINALKDRGEMAKEFIKGFLL
jgi:GLPGLI family protein